MFLKKLSRKIIYFDINWPQKDDISTLKSSFEKGTFYLVYDYSNDIIILPYENMEHFNKETMTMYLILRSEETMNV